MNSILKRVGLRILAARAALGVVVVWTALAGVGHSQTEPRAQSDLLPQRELVVKLYPCPAGQSAVIAEALRNEFGVIRGVRVAADERTSQVVVQAPAEVQARVSQRLATAGVAAPLPAGPAPGVPVQSASIGLRHISATQVEANLWSMLGNRLTSLPQAPRSNVRQYRLAMSHGGSAKIVIDSANNQVQLEGETAAVETLRHLITVIDAPQETDGRRVQLVPVHNAELASVERATDAIRHASGGDQPAPQVVASMFQQRPENTPPAGPALNGAASTDPKAPLTPPPPGGSPITANPEFGKALQAIIPGSINNPVQIEILEGLDLIIIRGNASDVEQVKKIIETIDAIAVQHQPAIEIVPIKNLDCEAMATFVKTLYDDAYAARQGAVTITPIVTPNSILIVGRQENVNTVKELVNRLDVPTAPGLQMHVFHLKHIAAGAAQTTISGTLALKTGGLSPVVHITADARTNSLIVQATPRDMAEVENLIQNIDVNQTESVNEVKLIQLEHSRAADIVDIINRAILGTAANVPQQNQQPQGQPNNQGQGGPQNQQGPQQPGQPPQQQAPAARPNEQQRVAMLRFMTIDARGRKLFNSGIMSDVKVTADPTANAIILSSPPENLELLEALIHQLDQLPAASAQIKVFTVVNGDATSLSEMLSRLFGGTGQTSGGGGGQAALQLLQQISAGGETSLVPLRFGVDTRTNSVIATGTASDLSVVEAILTRLDDGEVRHMKNIVFRLKNAPATQVAAALTEFLTKQQQNTQQAGAGLVSPFEQLEREVVIVPEPVSNSLILSATPRFFDEIKSLIEQLDARPPMVMIQVLIASIELGDTNEFGIELGLQDAVLFDRSSLTNLVQTQNTSAAGATTSTVIGADASPGFLFNNGSPLGNSNFDSSGHPSDVAAQGISNFGVGRSNSTLGYSGLVLSAASENVSAMLRALSEKHRVDILQRPQITTLDNQPAFIQVGQKVPTITLVTNNALNGNTNSVTTQNVGVILQVTPRISPDGLVVMQIDAEKSELESDATGIPIFTSPTGQVTRSPITDVTSAVTTVAAMSDQTIVLGGLIAKTKNQEHHGVPVLDDIPWVGNFFRFDSTSNEKTELLIIMTPHIIRNEHDADAIRRTEASKMSWCMCDVTKIYGEAGLRSRNDDWTNSEVPVVYPDAKGSPVIDQAPMPSPSPAKSGPEMIPAPSGAPVTNSTPKNNSYESTATVKPLPMVAPQPPADLAPLAPLPIDSGAANRVAPSLPGNSPLYNPQFVNPQYGVQPANYQQPINYQQPGQYQQPSQPTGLYAGPYAGQYQASGPVQPAYYQSTAPNNAVQGAVYQAPGNPLRNAPNVWGNYPTQQGNTQTNYPQTNYPQNSYSQPAVYQQPAAGNGPAAETYYR